MTSKATHRNSFEEKHRAGVLPPALRKLHAALPLHQSVAVPRRRIPAILDPCRQAQSARRPSTSYSLRKKHLKHLVPKTKPPKKERNSGEKVKPLVSKLNFGSSTVNEAHNDSSLYHSELLITPRWKVKDVEGAVQIAASGDVDREGAVIGTSPTEKKNRVKDVLGRLDVYADRPQTSYTIREVQFKQAEVKKYIKEKKDIEVFRQEIAQIRRHKLVGSPQSARARKPCRIKLQPSQHIETIECKGDLVQIVATPRPGASEAERLKTLTKEKVQTQISQFKFSDESVDLEDIEEGKDADEIDDDDVILMGVRSSAFQNVSISDNSGEKSLKDQAKGQGNGWASNNSSAEVLDFERDVREVSSILSVTKDIGPSDFNEDFTEDAPQSDDPESEGQEGMIISHTSPDVLKSLFS